MAIKVQGTTVIDDSRNITANVICGNFCGGSINISISPRTCNVGFVSGTSQVVCADTFESVRIRAESGLTVCVCNMPKGKPIFFDIGSTQGGNFCFRDSSNTSMSATCVTVAQGQAVIASLVQTPAFCGICCYYTEYSCAYQSWGAPTATSGVYKRRDIFGSGCNTSAFDSWPLCDGSWACACCFSPFMKGFGTGSSCGATFFSPCRCILLNSFGRGSGGRNGTITFADGRVLMRFSAFPQTTAFSMDFCESFFGTTGGYAVFCNGSGSPSLVACGHCWACCGGLAIGWCGCSACYGCRGTLIGADTTLGYVYFLGSGVPSLSNVKTLNVYPLSCWPFCSGGAVQQISFCGCVLCQTSVAGAAMFNLATNTNTPWVTFVGLRCAYGFGNSISWDAFKACKTGSAVCPLCFVISCNQTQASISCYPGSSSTCYNYENLRFYWPCGEKFLAWHYSGSPILSMFDAWCDVCPTGLCASWCLVQRWACNCQCVFTSVNDVTQSADGRFEAFSFCYGGPFQGGQGAGAFFWDCCRNASNMICLGVCTLLSVGALEFHLDNSCSATGPFCISGAGQFGWCYDGGACNWYLVGCTSCSECVRYYCCVASVCIPGSAGTPCFLCGGNGCATCVCNTLPFMPEYNYVSTSSGYSFYNFSANPNNCCTCQR